jgi:hypothetical protein
MTLQLAYALPCIAPIINWIACMSLDSGAPVLQHPLCRQLGTNQAQRHPIAWAGRSTHKVETPNLAVLGARPAAGHTLRLGRNRNCMSEPGEQKGGRKL